MPGSAATGRRALESGALDRLDLHKHGSYFDRYSERSASLTSASQQRSCSCGECAQCNQKALQVQQKSRINLPGDHHEQEADRIADQVLEGQSGPSLTRAPMSVSRVTAKNTDSAIAVPKSVRGVTSEAGSPLDSLLRQDMETRFQRDFSQVRVHKGMTAAQSAREVNARAYTVGQHIVFGAGEFSPESATGRKLLAHELAHTVQQSGISTDLAGDALVQRREIGTANDPLYRADHLLHAGASLSDRIDDRRLRDWAIARGAFVVRDDRSLMRMQEKDEVESDIVDEILLLLMDLLRGRDAQDGSGQDFIKATGVERARPSDNSTSLDKFEGSDNAREAAVIVLLEQWRSIEKFLIGQLQYGYRTSYLDALARTPLHMDVEDDTKEIARIRNNPYGHSHRIVQGLAGDVVFRVGQRYGRLNIVDIYKITWPNEVGGGSFWASVEGYPLWFYKGGVDQLNRNTVIGEVARSTAEAAKFAGMLWPLMIKAAGFVLTFSPVPIFMIAGVVIEQLGEEGLRDLEGESRTAEEIVGDGAKEILINLVLGKLTGGGGKAAAEGAQTLERVAEIAAAQSRTAIEKEIVRTEGSKVVRAIESGESHAVTEAELIDEGFTQEVHISHEGGPHTYRQKADGSWCRWSARRICNLGLPKAEKPSIYDEIVKEREAMLAPGERMNDEIGMRVDPRLQGKAPVESGVSGTMGEAGHAAEVAGKIPKPSRELLSPEAILKEREALLRGDITLRELVEKYPEEGAAQVFFPSVKGGGRYIDHVYLEKDTMFVVFRESKNVRNFALGERELAQLRKDLAYLTHPRFKGLRVEWRITGEINAEARAALEAEQKRSKGMFSFVEGPIGH